MQGVETRGKTVEEAIEKALTELGIVQDDAEIEVLAEGKAGGLFGLGGEDARVFVSVSGNRSEPVSARPRPARKEDLGLPRDEEEFDEDEPVLLPRTDSTDALDVGEEIVTNLMRLMKQRVQIGRYDIPNPMDPEGPIITVLNIEGDNLGVLIGRRGETLNSLQYLTNLMVSRRLKQRLSISVDVEGYRKRRAETLQNLATRMADRARETGESVRLEPMTPAERRLIHLALQEEQDVRTESSGEGDGRQVVIFPT